MGEGLSPGGVFSMAGLAVCCVASVVMLLFERRKTAKRVDRLEEQLYIALTEIELMKVDMEDSKQREVRESRRLSSGSLVGGTEGQTPEYPTKHSFGSADFESRDTSGFKDVSLRMDDTPYDFSDHQDFDSDIELIKTDDGMCGVDVEILRMSAREDDMEDNWLLHVPGRSIEIDEEKNTKVARQEDRHVVPKLNLSACDQLSWK